MELQLVTGLKFTRELSKNIFSYLLKTIMLLFSLFSYYVFVLVDTEHERNALMEHVYPKLRQFCQKKGYEFQVNLNQTVTSKIKVKT